MNMDAQWRPAQSPDGRTYYYNTVTKQTQWTKPEALLVPGEVGLANQPFVEYTTKEGRKYWYNKETKVSSWEMPEVYQKALSQGQQSIPVKPPVPANTFVAGGGANFAPYQPQQREREDYQQPERPDRGDRFDRDRERPSNHGQSDNLRSNFVPAAAGEPEYATYEEAEAAFMKVMKRYGVQPEWTFRQMVDACVKDPQYRAIKDPKDRQTAFEKYQVEARVQDKEREKERVAKLRQDFQTMLRSHPEITYYTRWKTARPIIEGETIFRNTDNEAERRQLFLEYINELQDSHAKQESATKRSALDELSVMLRTLVMDPYTTWQETQKMLGTNERYQNDDKFRSLHKSDVLNTFVDHIRVIERQAVEDRQHEKAQKARQERKNRDSFKTLLEELRSQGFVKAGARWMDVFPHVRDDPRFASILGQQGSTALDLFWDLVEEEEQIFRGQRNEVLDILDDKRFEMTSKTTLDAFLEIVLADRRTSHISRSNLELVFSRLHDKVTEREKEDRHQAERLQRRAIDALRSIIKHLDPPIRSSDSWDRDVRPRVESFEEFRALDEEARRTAFDKFIRRLKEKEADAEHERTRRAERTERSERDRDTRRNGDRRDRDRDRDRDHRGRAGGSRYSRTPEPDAYEADRKRAVAERERQYRKASGATSPLPLESRSSRHGRERLEERDRERLPDHDRSNDRERYDRSVGRAGVPVERERVGRDLHRERDPRPYVSRADPREGAAKELDYGESGSVGASGNGSVGASTRRRRGSEGSEDGDGSKRDVKRTKRERSSKSKTPVDVEAGADADKDEGLKSGSEEGEIEEG